MRGVGNAVLELKMNGLDLTDTNISDDTRLDVLLGEEILYKFVYGNNVSENLCVIH